MAKIKKIKNNNKKNNAKSVKNTKLDGSTYNKRIMWFMIFVFLLFVVILLAFGYWQFVKGDELRYAAANQQVQEEIIISRREKILDRNGEILAQSLPTGTVSINPNILREKNDNLNKDELASKIQEIFSIKKEEIIEKIDSKKTLEYIVRKADEDKVDELKKYIKDKKIIGINIDPDYKREYPYGEMAANVLGFCGVDHVGLEGLELQLNDILAGKEGRRRIIKDSLSNKEKTINEEMRSETGNVYLTIDLQIQKILEKHLKKAYKKYKDDSAIAIAMDPRTAEVLGVSVYPTYNPNTPFIPIDIDKKKFEKMSGKEKEKILQNSWKDRSITDGYEPRFSI